MPLYSISTKEPLSDAQREKLAVEIMNTHCGLTGAPETFVNVIYHHNVPLRRGVRLNVMGNVRKGRTPEMCNVLSLTLKENISKLMLIPMGNLELSLFEVPASKVMEGGEILPEPGEEDQCEWLQQTHI